MSATSTANGGVGGPVGVVAPPHNLAAEQSVLLVLVFQRVAADLGDGGIF